MTERIFVDTNILVYAHDRDAGARHHRAKELVAALWNAEERPCLSVQVLQELYVNLVKKNVPQDEAAETVSDYALWRVVDNDRRLLSEGFEAHQRWRLSFWDAMIVAAARRIDAQELWSEDMSVGQRYDGVLLRNPLG